MRKTIFSLMLVIALFLGMAQAEPQKLTMEVTSNPELLYMYLSSPLSYSSTTFDDSHSITFGTHGDWKAYSDTTTVLQLTPLTTNETSSVNIGADTLGADLKAFGATTGAYLLYDASGDSLTLAKGALTQSGGAVNVNASSNNAINLATGTSTGTVTIGGTGTQTIAIGNGIGIKTVGVGSLSGASATTVSAGTGKMVIDSNSDATDGIIIQAKGHTGGIDIISLEDLDISTTGAAGEDISITNTGGSVNITATEAAEGQVLVSASGTVAGNAITVATTNGGMALTAAGAANGDMTVTVGDDLAVAATGAASISSEDWGITSTGVATKIASIGFDSSSTIYYDTVSLSASDVNGLFTAPKQLVAAPGTHNVIEFVGATLIYDYGTAFTCAGNNLSIKYTDGSGAVVSDTISATGLLTATADTVATLLPVAVAATAATGMENKALVLCLATANPTVAGTSVMRVKVAYRIHPSGL